MVRKLKITKEITLDVSRLNRFQSIIAKQNDKDSRYLKVSVAEEGNVLIIPSSAKVTITATRPDKLSSSFLGKISEDGKAIVPLSPWMLELDGSLSCEVSIITEESVLKTTSFYVDVEPDESSGNTDVTQDPNYDILVELIQEVAGVAAIEKEAISTAVDAYLREKNIRPLQKGTDYWTASDKAEIIASVIEALGGEPIFGYVDENNNIVVQGNLADGTYSVKYEMENGTTVDIGNLVLDTNVYYSITNNITNCTSNNSATQVVEGERYFATITANNGYELKSVSVTMGGAPVSVSGGVINIASVTGDIVITAIAEEIVVEPTNLLPQAIFNTSEDAASSDKGYVSGYKISNSGGGLSQVTGCYSSGYIKVGINDTVTIKNITLRSDGNSNNIILYSNTNKGSKIIGKPGPTGAFDSGVTVSNGVYSFTPSTWTTDASVAYFRFSCGGITDESIVTVSKAIG